MNEFAKLFVITASLLCIGITTNAGAQGLKEKVMGAWTLNDESEIFQDGKKVTPWAAGSLILDPTGHFSIFVLGKEFRAGRWLLTTEPTQ